MPALTMQRQLLDLPAFEQELGSVIKQAGRIVLSSGGLRGSPMWKNDLRPVQAPQPKPVRPRFQLNCLIMR